jgi:hypothetical protein
VKNLPNISDLVLVRLSDSEVVWRSRVEDTKEDGFVTIAPPSDGTTTHELPLFAAVALEWIVDRGLGSVTGAVFSIVDVGVPGICVKLDAEPVIDQRRENARAEIVLDIEVRTADPAGDIFGILPEPVTGVTLDISGGGLRAVIPTQLVPDTLVRIAIEMREGKAVEVLARVVAQRDDGVIAFEFYEILPADRERLIKMVFASHRTAVLIRRTS